MNFVTVHINTILEPWERDYDACRLGSYGPGFLRLNSWDLVRVQGSQRGAEGALPLKFQLEDSLRPRLFGETYSKRRSGGARFSISRLFDFLFDFLSLYCIGLDVKRKVEKEKFDKR